MEGLRELYEVFDGPDVEKERRMMKMMAVMRVS